MPVISSSGLAKDCVCASTVALFELFQKMWSLLTCNGWTSYHFCTPKCYLIQCLDRYLIILDLSDYVYSKEETVYPYIVFWKHMGSCLGANSANQHTCLSSYPGLTLTMRFCAVLWYSEWTRGYGKRNTHFLFCFWFLAHKSHIAGWIAAEADSEILLSEGDIY